MAAFLGMFSMTFGQEKLSQKTIKALTHSSAAKIEGVSYSSQSDVNDKPINNNNHEKAGEYFDGDFSDASQWLINPSPLGSSNWAIEDNVSFPGYNLGGGQLIIDPITAVAGEKFAMFDNLDANSEAVYADQGGWIQINEVFDFTAQAKVALSFDQSYTGLNFDETFVQYSEDNGATWTDIQLNGAVAANTPYISSENFVLNTNNSDQFLIRFKYEALRNATAPENQQGGYVWQLYNVKVSEVSDNDIAVKTKLLAGFGPGTASVYDIAYTGDTELTGIGEDLFKYKQIPLSQVQAVNSMIRVENNGNNTQTNVKLEATETSAGYSSTSTGVALDAGDIEVLKVNGGFIPTAQGDYTVEYEITADETDMLPSNNQIASYEFNVGEYTYAIDDAGDAALNNTTLNNAWSAAGPAVRIEVGVLYEIVNTIDVTAIDIKLGFTSPTEGIDIWGVIYKDGENVMMQTEPTYIEETEYYTTGADDKGKYLTLKFASPITLTPGKYIVSAKSDDLTFSVASSGDNNLYNTFIYGALADNNPSELWFPLSDAGAPVVRMNFDPTVGIENNELANLNVSQNFPNPFANETTVLFNLKETANVSYTVVDLTGKVVANVNEGTTMAGEHEITIDGSSFANGVYYLNIVAGDSKVTRKMIVNK